METTYQEFSKLAHPVALAMAKMKTVRIFEELDK